MHYKVRNSSMSSGIFLIGLGCTGLQRLVVARNLVSGWSQQQRSIDHARKICACSAHIRFFLRLFPYWSLQIFPGVF